MDAFHTWRTRGDGSRCSLYDFELFTVLLSALEWRKHNGAVRLITDSKGAEYFARRGVADAWNETDTLLDGMDSLEINEDVFWAGAKLYALSRQDVPCVMMDLDFIVWKSVDFQQYGGDLAVIHREDLYPEVYPSGEFFRFKKGWKLPGWLNWSVAPCNGALVYFGSSEFVRSYTEFAFEFMQHADNQGDRLCYMVFAEQRWMAMCADHMSVPVHQFSSLPQLFDENQKYFTHVWGCKQNLRDNPSKAALFCCECAGRLQHDFPDFAEKLFRHNWAGKYRNDSMGIRSSRFEK